MFVTENRKAVPRSGGVNAGRPIHAECREHIQNHHKIHSADSGRRLREIRESQQRLRQLYVRGLCAEMIYIQYLCGRVWRYTTAI